MEKEVIEEILYQLDLIAETTGESLALDESDVKKAVSKVDVSSLANYDIQDFASGLVDTWLFMYGGAPESVNDLIDSIEEQLRMFG